MSAQSPRPTTLRALLALVAIFCDIVNGDGIRGNPHHGRTSDVQNPMTPWLEKAESSHGRNLQTLFDRTPSDAAVPSASLASTAASTPEITVGYVNSFNTTVWVSVPVPFKEAQTMGPVMQFDSVTSQQFLAVRGTEVGVHTVFYDVLLDLDEPFTKWEGDLVPNTLPVQSEFRFSPWVIDDLSRILPTYFIDTPSGVLTCGQSSLERETDTVAHQTFRTVTRCGSMVLEFWAHVFDLSDVVEWQLLAVFSDSTTQSMEITVNSFNITFGEYVHVDDKLPLGIPPTTYDSGIDKWTASLVSDSQVIGDAQGLPIFKGALICMDNSAPWDIQLSNPTITRSTQFANVLYRVGGWVLTGRNWDNRWLAFQATIPKLSQDDAELDSMYNSQWNFMQTEQDLYVQRKLGLNKYAGSTGGQGDFGSQKGSQTTLGDLRPGMTWHYHLQEALRPFHYREVSGGPTTGTQQPGWVTWSQKTHWHCSVSPNRLGKPCPTPEHTTHGWSGKDDQHKSSNALNAAIAAFDWPAHRALLRDEINVALENVRFLPGQHEGGVRAVGRRMLADANAFLLTGDEWVWERLVIWHAHNAFVKSETGAVVNGTTFRCQDIYTGDKPPFIAHPTTGLPVPSMIVWQHGLLMKGLTAAWSTHLYRQSLGLPNLPSTTSLETLISEITITFVRHCFAQVNGAWQTWNLIAWNNGQPLGNAIIGNTADTPGATQQRITVTNSWWEWIFPGFYYMARANHGVSLPQDVVDRLDSMADEWETSVFPTSDISTREWFPFSDSTL